MKTRRILLCAPFLVLPLVLRMAVPTLAERTGRALSVLVSDREATDVEGAREVPRAEVSPPPRARSARLDAPRARIRSTEAAPAVFSEAGPGASATEALAHEARRPSADVLVMPAKGTLVVPSNVVARALAKKDIRAVNATLEGVAWGARIQGVGRYQTALREGDVIVAVGGRRTTTVAAVIEAALASAGGTQLSGRIARGTEVWDVVLELPTGSRP